MALTAETWLIRKRKLREVGGQPFFFFQGQADGFGLWETPPMFSS